jgi:lysozyme family protein
MNVWPTAIAFVLEEETGGDPLGGYTNDPDDDGLETKWGISKRAHPTVDIRNLTREGAQQIYWNDYWQPVRAPELPAVVGLVVFDWSVTSPRSLVVRRLQALVGAVEDGIIGPDTIARAFVPPALDLALDLLVARARHMGAIVKAKPVKAKYVGGWASRLVRLTALVCRLTP